MLWGICSDTIKLPIYKNAPKKSIWVTFVTIECVLLFITGVFEMPNVGLFIALITLGNLCLQFFNTVVAGILTIQQRRDPVNGASDLVPFQVIFLMVGIVSTALVGGYLADHKIGRFTFVGVSFLAFI
jgi:predicted MFS family arabinose efflux permease